MKFVVPLSIPSSLRTEQPATPFFIMSMSGVPLMTNALIGELRAVGLRELRQLVEGEGLSALCSSS